MNSSMVNEITTVNSHYSNDSNVITRPIIFINSSDPVNPKQTITHSDNSLMFRPPFPPVLEAGDIFGKKQNGTNPTKPPNAFILYRRAFVKSALVNGYKLPMTVISSMASQAWEQELPFVKDEYKKIAKEAKKNHDALFPKVPKPSESKRWRVYPIKPKNISTPEKTTPLTANKESLINSEPSTPSTLQIVNENDVTSNEWEQLFNFYVDLNNEKNDEQNVFIWEDFLENYDNSNQMDYMPELSTGNQRDTFLNIENSAQNFDIEPEMAFVHFEQNQISESLNSFDSLIESYQEVSPISEPLEFSFPKKPDNFFDQNFLEQNIFAENLDEQFLSFLPIF